MKTQIISGSHRANSQSMRVAQYLKSCIEKKGGTGSITDLSHSKLPLWDEGVWAGEVSWKQVWGPIEAELKAADSLIVISPEYAGMASPALKNFFLFCGGDLLAHKPALLVSVTTSLTNGAYPIQELRGSGYKNSHVLYLPEHLIVREVEHRFDGEAASSEADGYLRKRAGYCLDLLAQYEKALLQVRQSGVVNLQDYPFGM
jgi:NAD(P)H-dependent FMN reductase